MYKCIYTYNTNDINNDNTNNNNNNHNSIHTFIAYVEAYQSKLVYDWLIVYTITYYNR